MRLATKTGCRRRSEGFRLRFARKHELPRAATALEAVGWAFAACETAEDLDAAEHHEAVRATERLTVDGPGHEARGQGAVAKQPSRHDGLAEN